MAEQGFTLTSDDFTHGAPLPPELTCDGADTSPSLHWLHPPEGTRSFALILEDPDAPRGTFTHWVLFDIPAATRDLAKGDTSTGIAGRNDFQRVGYGGPCPPPNHGSHRYFFKLFALDVESLEVKEGAKRTAIESAMQGHVLGQAELLGHYARTPGDN